MARPEIELVEIAYRAALARIGLGIGALAREEWRTVNPLKPEGGAWERRTMQLIFGGRSLIGHLTEALLRLIAGLESVSVPEGSRGQDAADLDGLRDEFFDLLDQVMEFDFAVDSSTDPDVQFTIDALRGESADNPDLFPTAELEEAIADWLFERGPNGDVKFREFAWPHDEVSSMEDATKAFQGFLDEAGLSGLREKIARLSKRFADDADGFADAVQAEFESHGSLIAGVADKASVDAGREMITNSAMRMSRRLMVARGVRSDPCHFCAMLASRGFRYVSTVTAMRAQGVQSYHPNCHCFPIVRWETKQLPERNAYYEKMWPKVTEGYFGADARKKWRNWINAERRRKSGARSSRKQS